MIRLSSALSSACLIVLGIVPQALRAQDDSWRNPLADRNQFPVALLFIMPEPESGLVFSRGEQSFSLNFSYANVLAGEDSLRESLLIDWECLNSTLAFRAGLGAGTEGAISLPIYTAYGGFLDPLISDLHDTFGFPNKLRSSLPNNIYQYHYRVNGLPVLERASGGTFVGDLTLQARKSVLERNPLGLKLAVRSSVKLPTGSREKLSGSDTTDFGVGISASRVGRSVGGYFQFDYLIPGSTAGLDTHNFTALTGAFDWRFRAGWPNLAMVIQYNQFQPFLRSELSLLSQAGRQILLGLRWRQSDRFYYEWRISEEVTSTAADVTFGFRFTINRSKH